MSKPSSHHDTTQTLAQRIEQLEIKLSYADDLLETLNTLVARQQDQIGRLLRDVAQLQRQREDETQPALRNPRDERPPHY